MVQLALRAQRRIDATFLHRHQASSYDVRHMTRTRIILGIAFLIGIIAIWVWWNRAQPVDMTDYAPADALVYIEANDLPQIATAITSTSAWRSLAAPARFDFNPRQFEWLTWLAGRTGIGSAEAVVLSRAQVAVVVLGVEATEAPEVTIKPRLAIVVETHTGERRVRGAIDKLIGDFAKRAYGEPQIHTREAGGVRWTTWALPAERRQIVAATIGSLAVVGNDEQTVETCLAVRRGERPSLSGDRNLEEMRRRTKAGDALTFGYVSAANAAKLLEIGATVYAAQLTLSPQVQSTAATLLPQLLPRLVGAVGWSAHAGDDRIEDRYFFQIQESIAARLQSPLTPTNESSLSIAGLLPAETHQVSAYLYRDPEAAWRGAQAALSSQLDFGLAPLLIVFADKSLEPYGIAAPREFFRLTAPPIATSRLDEGTNTTVIVARVRDPEAMMRLLRRRFGSRMERVGSYSMLIRSEADATEAASLVDNHLLMGDTDAVRRCLSAIGSEHTLLASESFKRAMNFVGDDMSAERASVTGYTEEQRTVRQVMRTLTGLRGSNPAEVRTDVAGFNRALKEHAYAFSETRLVSGGFDKRTRSVFGLFGDLINQLNANDEIAQTTRAH